MIDTIRIVVDWRCNLSCDYCCNEKERFRRQFKTVSIREIDWSRYRTVCISGGEPLLFPQKIEALCRAVPPGKFVVVYTNAFHLSPALAECLDLWGVRALTVGLHIPETFGSIITRTSEALAGRNITARFNVHEAYRERIGAFYPGISFRFWAMDDCDRGNEERVVLADAVQRHDFTGRMSYKDREWLQQL